MEPTSQDSSSRASRIEGGTPPASWTLSIEDHSAPSEGYAALIAQGSLGSEEFRVVARLPHGAPIWSDEAQERVLAGARLMAAAPELLAALVAAYRDLVDCSLRLSLRQPGSAVARELLGRADQIAPVIAKAKGGE